MSRHYGKAGKSARVMAEERFKYVYWVAGGFFLIGVLIFLNIGNFIKVGFFGTAIILFLIMQGVNRVEKKALAVKNRAKDAERGAVAEEKVADELAKLPEGYHIFNDVDFKGFNVDHIVVGPVGIILVETKSHRGRVTAEDDNLFLNGKPPAKNFLNQCWRQSKELEGFLYRQTSKEWKVKPILCLTNAFIQVRRPVKGVVVSNIGYLLRAIMQQPENMAKEDIEHLAQVLRFWITRHETEGIK